jgi:hypothetical protein
VGRVHSLPDRSIRAHQRFLREFLQAHIEQTAPLRAFEMWVRGLRSTA